MYFYQCKACEAIWYMDGDKKSRKILPKYCPMCGKEINYDTPKNYIFISKPNKCEDCPLDDVPLTYKIALCCERFDKYIGRYIVDYSLDDLGHTICKVRLK